MVDKEQSGSKLDALLERIPITDGGGRRRLTAGTIVLLTGFAVSPEIGQWIVAASKEASLSILLAAGALLIYAVGVAVELIGEVFLARAIANAVWSYLFAKSTSRTWRGWRVYLRWPFIVVWGSARAIPYFVIGLFGVSRWRMRPRRRLSLRARLTLKAQPTSVRNALEQPLGSNAEFGRRALIDQLSTTESRLWAKRLLDRPKDVLALVSAIVFSVVIVAFSPTSPVALSLSMSKELEARRDAVAKDLRDFGEIALKSQRPVIVAFIPFSSDVERLVSLELRYDANLERFDADFDKDGVRMFDALDKVDSSSPEAGSALVKLASSADNLRAAQFEARSELVSGVRQRIVIRSSTIIVAVFLYVAFFNTLTSATISVIEAVALERAATMERRV
jgi:hypothetical protein